MNRAEHISALLGEFAQKRARDRAEMDARIAETEARDPEIAQLRARTSGIALNALRDMLRAEGAEEKRAIAERMRTDGLANNAAIRARLSKLNLPEDYMEEKYACDKCRDTGYTDDMPAKFCECFERELSLRMFEDGSMAGVDEQNFKRFDAALIRRANNDENAERIITAKAFCENYAGTFPNTVKPNILFYGPGGVGKTFLLNCVFERVVARGYSAVRVTAYRMLEMFRKKHIGDDGESFDSLMEAPLLLIDDLGTEPMYKNITVEYLFTLLNERCASRRHTVIATNLEPAEILERYSERVSSRLLDVSRSTLISMKGADLRLGKLQ